MIERFRNSSTAVQAGLVLAGLAGVTVPLLALWFFLLRTPYEPIFSQLKPADAAAIIAELDKRKVPYQLADGGATVEVPKDRADASRVSLNGGDLSLKQGTGFELFDKSDMGITDFAQKINYQRALQGELERTIAALDGVDSVRVHLSMGDDRLFRQDRAAPKASVTLRMRGDAPVPEEAAAGVRLLVSASVPQLDSAAVVVLDAHGRVADGRAGSDNADEALSPAQAEQRAIGHLLAARTRAALDQAFGRNSFAVSITVSARLPEARPTTAAGRHHDLASRDFPIQVLLTPHGEYAEQVRQAAQRQAAETLDFSPELGDTLQFTPSQTTPVVASPPRAAPERASALVRDHERRQPPGSQSPGLTILAAMGAGLTVAAALWLAVRRLGGRGLSESERMSFAARLAFLLEQDMRDAAV